MSSSPAAIDFEPRAICGRCRRPVTVCYCRHLPSVDARTRVVLLQHPRERDVAIGTARMASLCLPNSELHVGVSWDDSPELARALSDPSRPPILLYPGDGAKDLAVEPPRGPVTLVVVDGTWWQARKLVRVNQTLGRLPRYAFTPPSPSEYRIRREPNEAYVSTLEALVHALAALEGDAPRFQALLLPFRAMVDAQIECQRRRASTHSRHPKKPQRPRLRVPGLFAQRPEDLVCVVGEANAWPYRSRRPEREDHPDELVHWAARRTATGETFDVVVAPRHPIAPGTTSHVGLSREALLAGTTLEDLHARFRAFSRPTDIVCSWGRYATSLFAAGGGSLPGARADLRVIARVHSGGRVGTLEGFAEGLGVAGRPPSGVPGRAGARLALVSSMAERFAALAREERVGREDEA